METSQAVASLSFLVPQARSKQGARPLPVFLPFRVPQGLSVKPFSALLCPLPVPLVFHRDIQSQLFEGYLRLDGIPMSGSEQLWKNQLPPKILQPVLRTDSRMVRLE